MAVKKVQTNVWQVEYKSKGKRKQITGIGNKKDAVIKELEKHKELLREK